MPCWAACAKHRFRQAQRNRRVGDQVHERLAAERAVAWMPDAISLSTSKVPESRASTPHDRQASRPRETGALRLLRGSGSSVTKYYRLLWSHKLVDHPSGRAPSQIFCALRPADSYQVDRDSYSALRKERPIPVLSALSSTRDEHRKSPVKGALTNIGASGQGRIPGD
jgi:hypothetical protein